MSKKNKKGKKAVDVSQLFDEKQRSEIVDADYTDIDDIMKSKKESKNTVNAAKSDVDAIKSRLGHITKELKYRTAAAKSKKEDSEIEEPASVEDVEELRKAAIDAVTAFAEKLNLDMRYANELIDTLKSPDPERVIKIAKRVEEEIAKSEVLRTYREWFERGRRGEGWFFDPEHDDYEISKLTGTPLDREAIRELSRIYEKYREPFKTEDAYWETSGNRDAVKKAQASYHRFLTAVNN